MQRNIANVPYVLSGAHPISVTLCGMGGTGSSVITHLARIHLSLVAKGLKGLMVTAVDADNVTPANMGRQLFTENDLGRNKAVALIERVNRFYGTPWQAVPEMFDYRAAAMDNFPGNIFISCVDNTTTREFIHKYLYDSYAMNWRETIRNFYWIDTGNTVDAGQVIMGSHHLQLQTIVDLYPNLKEFEDKDDTPSCSLAEALEKQDLFINTLVAHVTGQLVWDITTKPVLDWIGAYINISKQTPIVKIRA